VAACCSSPELAQNKVLEVVAETTAPKLSLEELLAGISTDMSEVGGRRGQQRRQAGEQRSTRRSAAVARSGGAGLPQPSLARREPWQAAWAEAGEAPACTALPLLAPPCPLAPTTRLLPPPPFQEAQAEFREVRAGALELLEAAQQQCVAELPALEPPCALPRLAALPFLAGLQWRGRQRAPEGRTCCKAAGACRPEGAWRCRRYSEAQEVVQGLDGRLQELNAALRALKDEERAIRAEAAPAIKEGKAAVAQLEAAVKAAEQAVRCLAGAEAGPGLGLGPGLAGWLAGWPAGWL
jgi:hypothetical protein